MCVCGIWSQVDTTTVAPLAPTVISSPTTHVSCALLLIFCMLRTAACIYKQGEWEAKSSNFFLLRRFYHGCRCRRHRHRHRRIVLFAVAATLLVACYCVFLAFKWGVRGARVRARVRPPSFWHFNRLSVRYQPLPEWSETKRREVSGRRRAKKKNGKEKKTKAPTHPPARERELWFKTEVVLVSHSTFVAFLYSSSCRFLRSASSSSSPFFYLATASLLCAHHCQFSLFSSASSSFLYAYLFSAFGIQVGSDEVEYVRWRVRGVWVKHGIGTT